MYRVQYCGSPWGELRPLGVAEKDEAVSTDTDDESRGDRCQGTTSLGGAPIESDFEM